MSDNIILDSFTNANKKDPINGTQVSYGDLKRPCFYDGTSWVTL